MNPAGHDAGASCMVTGNFGWPLHLIAAGELGAVRYIYSNRTRQITIHTSAPHTGTNSR